MNSLDDLKKMLEELIENDREHVEYSSLPVDENCEEPFGTSSIWSWAVPMPEHGDRPRFLLCGDGGPESWDIVDVLEDADGWPANLVIAET